MNDTTSFGLIIKKKKKKKKKRKEATTPQNRSPFLKIYDFFFFFGFAAC